MTEDSTAGGGDITSAKLALRTRALRNRAVMEIDSHRVCNGIAHFLRRRKAERVDADGDRRWIVGYSAMPGEADLAELMSVHYVDLGPFALTRTPATGRELSIHPADSELERHRFGYDQPVEGSVSVAYDLVDVVLVPGLAFDRSGGRLGFGAGFYDRFLAHFGPDTALVAVSNGFIVDEVPTEPHDVTMTHLASEIGVVSLPLDPVR